MKKERMNDRDVMAHLRAHGVLDLREVRLATVEDDGEVSVLLRDWAEPVKRADVDKAAADQRRKDTAGEDEPPAAARTDDARYL
jgi:uncharacterized membrane protein YcaP (DUF421 family)